MRTTLDTPKKVLRLKSKREKTSLIHSWLARTTLMNGKTFNRPRTLHHCEILKGNDLLSSQFSTVGVVTRTQL